MSQASASDPACRITTCELPPGHGSHAGPALSSLARALLPCCLRALAVRNGSECALHECWIPCCIGDGCKTCPPRALSLTCRLNAWGAFFNETFGVTPDFPDHPKALRLTLSPVFAHYQHKGSKTKTGYRWMLVGDDDTGAA